MTIATTHTLTELVHECALHHPDRIALRVLGDGETVTAELTYQLLWTRAAQVAAQVAAVRRAAPARSCSTTTTITTWSRSSAA